jgi:hypothetical protein
MNNFGTWISIAGITNPIWLSYIHTSWQFSIALVGGVALLFTAWNKILENKKLRRELRERKNEK